MTWLKQIKTIEVLLNSKKFFCVNDMFGSTAIVMNIMVLNPSLLVQIEGSTRYFQQEMNTNGFEASDDKTLNANLKELRIEKNVTEAGDPSQNNKIRDLEKKREDYLEWPEYFMAVAFLSAMRSKDPCTQVGACITDSNNRIVGVGYNGMPIGCSDDILPWGKTSSKPLETKYMYVCHAEMNAIMNKNSADLRGCTLYVALFPCNECAKLIIQAGIKLVVYMSDKHKNKPSTEASKLMFNMAGVKHQQFTPKNSKIIIDFEEIDWNTSI